MFISSENGLDRFVTTLTTHDATVDIRPLAPEDAPALQAFFYTHDSDTIRARYRFAKRGLSEEEARFFCTLDYRERFALGAFVAEGEKRILVGVGRYEGDPTSHTVETDLVVAESWRRRGIATRLWHLLAQRAKELGYDGVNATFDSSNGAAMALHRHLGLPLRVENGDCVCHLPFEGAKRR